MLAVAQSCAVVGLDGYIAQIEVVIPQVCPPSTLLASPTRRFRKPESESGRPCSTATASSSFGALPLIWPQRTYQPSLRSVNDRSYPSEFRRVRLPEEPSIFLGELSLDDSLRHTNGILPIVSVAEDQGSIVTHRDKLEGGLVLPGFSCPGSKLF